MNIFSYFRIFVRNSMNRRTVPLGACNCEQMTQPLMGARRAQRLIHEVKNGAYALNSGTEKFIFQRAHGETGVAHGFRMVRRVRTKRRIIHLQQHAQIMKGRTFKSGSVSMIGTKLVLHNLHKRAQLARIHMGLLLRKHGQRNAGHCRQQHQQGKKGQDARDIH